ncbi:MAG: DnaJ protein [Proteobacteria bacterium]|nr:DnaJ protein [Pseudomonadota bacterium]
MKYKDYYSILGVDRSATTDAIKKAYRKLAHRYHPDVSEDPEGEEKFKALAEAYETLKNPEKRAAYDQLGRHQPGQDFQPPPGWGPQHGDSQFAFDDADLADLFAGFSGGRQPGGGAIRMPGQDYEVTAQISLEQAYSGTEVELNLTVPEHDAQGQLHRVPRSLKVRIPKGATDGQRLRLAGRGGKGFNGGRDGDLYLQVKLQPHTVFRVSGHDLYLDLPLAPWEAVLGATIDVPTLGGTVRLKVPPHTQAGQQLRLSGRGLPRPHGKEGDLFAIAQIVVPATATDVERGLFEQLAKESTFNPRARLQQEMNHAP